MGSYVPRGNWHRDAEKAGLIGPSDAEKVDRFVADYEADKMELALGGAGEPAPQPATPEPVGPTEADWEASTVRGWTKDGEECRAVPYFAYGVRFVTRYRSAFILVGETAYAERPPLPRAGEGWGEGKESPQNASASGMRRSRTRSAPTGSAGSLFEIPQHLRRDAHLAR